MNVTPLSRAPWTSEQVVALEARQNRFDLHPYTCPNRGDPPHLGEGLLEPTVYGWECPFCAYTQDWAHAVDVEGGP